MATKELRAVANRLTTCLGLGLYRFRQCALYGPATLKSTAQAIGFYSKFRSQVFHAHRLSLKRKHDIASSIARLLVTSRPVTIAFFVVAIVVAAFNAVIERRARSHVGVKNLKRIPFITDCDASMAVAMKVLRVRIVAAVFHVLPRGVFRSALHAMLFVAWLASSATTRSQFRTLDWCFCAAFAATVPINMTPGWMVYCLTDNRPFTESLPGQVYKAMIATSRIAVSHLNLMHRFKVVRTARALKHPGCSHFSTFAIGATI